MIRFRDAAGLAVAVYAVELGARRYTPDQLAARLADLDRAEELIDALYCGAEERSQSHIDVVAKIDAYYGGVFDQLPPLSEEERTHAERIAAAVLARIREIR